MACDCDSGERRFFWGFGILGGIFMAGLIWLVLYEAFVDTEDGPTFRVHSITTTPTTPPFSTLISNNTVVVNATTVHTTAFNITFHIGDPNMGILNKPANVSVYYHRHPVEKGDRPHDYYLSSASLDSFCHAPNCRHSDNEAWVSVTVVVLLSVSISDDLAAAFTMVEDLKRGEYGITIKVTADYRTYQAQDDYCKLSFTCNDFKISVPTGVMVGNPRKCISAW